MVCTERKYDLEERTGKFGRDVLDFCRKVPVSAISRTLVNQLVRSATSVGANYCEADDAQTKPDFVHKIAICKKEARETTHWFKMIKHVYPELSTEAEILSQEATELNLIFNAIINTARKSLAIRH